MSAIAVDGLTKRFGDVTAVDDLSFTVQAGTVTGFVGPNGAGKWTTLRPILGVARPDSGTAAAIGYARESGIPFGQGLMRSHYAGRTFIEPSQSIRHFGVKLKLSPVREVLDGKRVVVVDEPIVRGTTSRKIVQMMRDAGATEVHFRIASPPITHPDYYGIDTPERDKLLADMTDELAEHVLMDNYRQSMALTHAEAQSAATLDEAARFIRRLERAGALNRVVELLPAT